MTKKTSVLGVIHARGGSKRIPMKNIKLLMGKPLIAYIIEAALSAKTLDRVIVSTDHPEIIRIAKEYGADVPFVRPPDLAEDVPSEMVTQHAVNFVEQEQGSHIDIAVTMQPTTPFCTGKDIDACVDMLLESSTNSVFSSKTVKERPEWMFKINEHFDATLLLGDTIQGETGVTQSLPILYIPNGGIYATRRQTLFEENVIISNNSKIYVMSQECSVDIDEPEDFILAEIIAERLINDK